MELRDYIDRHVKGDEVAFSLLSGVPRSTLRSIMQGGGARAGTIRAIRDASNGLVGVDDLLPAAERPKRGAK